ncbi:hypothetical protein ACFQJ5_03280 [Halomicroarcula sp. GCM10025324]|uniref:hypothetical protein n=1 Tax=Haloarcula TaxID=2237 RepID=UPI0023E7C040|nr:hypothetical protein [Halomicroarcula sp. ZS-22-S1]
MTGDGPSLDPPYEMQEVTHPEKYVVEFTGPYSFRVPTSMDEEHRDAAYSVVLDEIEAELRLGESEGGRSAFEGDGAASFPRDRHGLLLNQKVQIHFSEDYISSLPDDIEEPVYEAVMFGSKSAGLHKRLIEDSIDFYNRFIECYKVVTESYWMRAVIPNEIVNFTIRKVEGGEVIDETSIGLTGGMLQMGTISPHEDGQLRKSLQEENDVTISRQLDLDIRDKMDLGEYTIAVYNSNQLFEFWTRREYTKMLRAQGKTEREAEDRMWHSGNDQYHHIKGIYDMIESDVGVDIKDTPEWDLWYTHCRDTRNELIHEGRRATELDAIYAYYYTQKAMKEFKRRFVDAFN